MTHNLRLGLVQHECTDDTENNFARAVAGVREAARQGARLVCLQELFRTVYFCQHHDPQAFALSEPIPGPTTDALGELAQELDVAIVASIFERRTAGLHHNSAAVIDSDGSLVGVYRKMHVPHDPGYFEKYYFAPGDTGFAVFEVASARIAVLICWDQWFPEAARLATLAGAQVILYPTAIAWDSEAADDVRATELNAWETVQRAHAIAGGVFVGAVNRTGHEGALEFWGSSFVVDPQGRVLERAPTSSSAVLVVDCDLESIAQTRQVWPFLRDRRPDAYGDLVARYRGPS